MLVKTLPALPPESELTPAGQQQNGPEVLPGPDFSGHFDVQPQGTKRRGFDFKSLPRCLAKAKSTQERCRLPAMKGKTVCYIHGGKGGAPKGNKNRQTHGERSRENIEARKVTRAKIRRLMAEARIMYGHIRKALGNG